jgi:MFS transporter, FHS family, glucose/mannose:H+ symporter
MALKPVQSAARTLAVLHPVFALTGVLHAVIGSLVPSIALRFHLSDSESGLLFLLYYAGTSIGALLCRWNFARTIAVGFVAVAGCCLAVAIAPRSLLPSSFLFLGVSVGVPMSAVSLFVGRAYPQRCAPTLTLLNFSWSIGALASPLIAARILSHRSYVSAYVLFSVIALVAALASSLTIEEPTENERPLEAKSRSTGLLLILVFASAAFLEVGIENTAAAWMPTYALRAAQGGLAAAAAASSAYWFGFLTSRGLNSLVLMRVSPARVFRLSVAIAIICGLLLPVVTSTASRGATMFLLGAALAPVYPLVITGAIARLRRTSDSRWVMAAAGIGGSVLPWIAGIISVRADSLRLGMLVIPAALLLMLLMIPTVQRSDNQISAQ